MRRVIEVVGWKRNANNESSPDSTSVSTKGNILSSLSKLFARNSTSHEGRYISSNNAFGEKKSSPRTPEEKVRRDILADRQYLPSPGHTMNMLCLFIGRDSLTMKTRKKKTRKKRGSETHCLCNKLRYQQQSLMIRVQIFRALLLPQMPQWTTYLYMIMTSMKRY
jgi:hypothetical protein